MAARYWLIKSEPEVYSIEHLREDRRTLWDGVRNYQARNLMMNDMSVGDLVLFYHSNAEPPGIAGLAKVSGAAVADPAQFDRKSPYFDEKAKVEKPTWFCVQIEFVEAFARLLPLDRLRKEATLEKMALLQRGQRLSVQPVAFREFQLIMKLAERE